MATLSVTQRRSRNGANPKQLDTLRSLGLRRIGHTVEIPDNEATRGMVRQVRFLVSVEEIDGERTPEKAGRRSPANSGDTKPEKS